MLHQSIPSSLALATVLLIFSYATHAEPPKFILETTAAPHQPHMAIFDKPSRQAILINCTQMRVLWEAVPVKKVTAAEYASALKDQAEVVDLFCKTDPKAGEVRKFQQANGPGAIVVKPRDSAVYQRHYVHPSDAWFATFGGSVVTVTESELVAIAPKRGPDLTNYRLQPWCIFGLNGQSPSSGFSRFKKVDIQVASPEEASAQARKKYEEDLASRPGRGAAGPFNWVSTPNPYPCRCDDMREPRPSKQEHARCS